VSLYKNQRCAIRNVYSNIAAVWIASRWRRNPLNVPVKFRLYQETTKADQCLGAQSAKSLFLVDFLSFAELLLRLSSSTFRDGRPVRQPTLRGVVGRPLTLSEYEIAHIDDKLATWL
jgi:hypothetical protein